MLTAKEEPSTDFRAVGMDGAGPSLQCETSNKQTKPMLLEPGEGKRAFPAGQKRHKQPTLGNGELAQQSDQRSAMLVVDMKKQPGRAKKMERKEVGVGGAIMQRKGGLALRGCHGTSRWHPSVPHISPLSSCSQPANEEIEAQRGYMACPRPPSKEGLKQRSKQFIGSSNHMTTLAV